MIYSQCTLTEYSQFCEEEANYEWCYWTGITRVDGIFLGYVGTEQNLAKIRVTLFRSTDEVEVTNNTPGFKLLETKEVGQAVTVHAVIHPPVTSSLTHILIAQIVA